MTNTAKCWYLFCLLTVFVHSVKGLQAAVQDQRPPNVIFIFVDDMGYGDLSCTGNRLVQTPHIDRLAADGIRFTNFYVASPICSPSRVGVTTGQFPARHGINSYLNSRERNQARGMVNFLDPQVPCIARTFQDAGYATAHFGKWHMGGGRDVNDAPLPQAYGFDESLVSFEGLGDRILPPGRLSRQSRQLKQGKIRNVAKHEQTRIYVDHSIDFIRRHASDSIYLHLWLNDVHDGHHPSEDQLQEFQWVSPNPFVQKFCAVLVEMDRQIGRLIDAIDGLGLSKKTIIVLTSDNGPTAWPRYYDDGVAPPGSTGGFRGRKWSLYEGGIRMPLIIRWSGKIAPRQVDTSTVTGAVDFFPTFCALAGVEAPMVDFDGEDMSQAVLGRPQQRTKPLIWEYGRDESYLRPGDKSDVSPNLAMRDGHWKFLINDDGSDPQLYDFRESTAELHNVGDRYPDVTKKLSQHLLNWRQNLPTFP